MSKSTCKICGCETNFPLDTCDNCMLAEQGGFENGYASAVADICAGLRTKRTKGGETITGAVHAAEVIQRGDFVGFAKE